MSFIVIDSSRNNCIGSTTNFKYLLNKSISFKKISLIYAAIPYSSYLINANNCNFKIHFDDGADYTITLSFGNYDVQWLATTIKTMVNHSNFNIVFDSWIMKYIFSADQNFQIISSNNSINYVLGLNDEWKTSNLNILVGDKIINFLNDTILYIKLNNYTNRILQDDWFLYTFLITNTANKNEICFYNTNNQFKNEITFGYYQCVNWFDLQIYDQDNAEFVNNGLPCQFVLFIE